ncbi:heat shock factor binding protein 1-domain-containing protein [Neohortaea acidophila]|uniref:Heat shock factor binding protein 1-domain-containing protein n=1 Tax=Neohortaea acidophila TaxID=245834 RepID=A0A6A6Q224_9PEZI|nr:heat shock factor binding protein 1-domain-containing protein [Neohortaea acidophila]KAF2486071.1 heat shock factor binding protein 1-domain-containing protein [Neohortaea acidophila]
MRVESLHILNMSDSTTLSAQVDKLNIGDASNPDTAPSELVAVVDDLLNQLSSKFSNMSSELIGKMDEMSRRLDALEASIHGSGAQGKDEEGDQ